jgi:hypothetical protein
VFELESALGTLTVGDPLAGAGITLWPLLGPNARTPGYDLARDAFANGTLRVNEISETGAVPTLRVANDGPRPVLLVDGEQLIGAKQNRVLNVTVFIPAGVVIDVPVSCVEAGRWHYRQRAFTDDDYLMNVQGRALNMRNVSDTLRRGRSRAGSQRAVWDHIAERAACLGAESPTGAMRDTFDRHRDHLDKAVLALRPLPRQVGALFAVHGRFTGLELFDSPATLAAMFPKLVRSYALDALAFDARRTSRGAPPDADPVVFLHGVSSLRAESYPAVGLGTELRLEGRGLHGAALVVNDELLHLSVLADPDVWAPEFRGDARARSE